MPIVFTQSATCSGVKLTLTPSASKTSALPQVDETERPPCLATFAPAAAATKAETVETLKVCMPSPPVPQVSIKCVLSAMFTLVESERITVAAAVISSTVSAFVAAAAGAKVAKHGGRSVSSTCGSADVLEALGVNVNLSPEQVADCVNTIGIGFMFAPNHHSAMKHSAPVRRELGVRTLFNLLGPLTNPANAKRQVMGVFRQDLTLTLAKVLQNLGSEHVLVVHGADGMDEISFTGDTAVAELKNG